MFNSLRGRIWISTSVLAFFICTFGLISYLVVTLLVNDVFYGIIIPFLFLAFTVVVFGWWLSNEIVSPIEKVTLLSKSLERTSSTTIPKSSGAFETDQLLQTLYRNSQQVQMIVTMMEQVAAGNQNISHSAFEGSDRLSASLQKILAKISESITAREELDDLTAAIERINREISPVRSGNLDVRLSTDNYETREITATIRYLIDNLAHLITHVKSDSDAARENASNIESHLRTVVQQDENRIEEMKQASVAMKKVPSLVQKISEDLSRSAGSARQSIEKVRKGAGVAAQNSAAVSKLRKQMREAIKRVQTLNERTQEIDRLANTVEDLANRTNMIALNASIQAAELGESGQGFGLVAEEVERLAERAGATNRQISALNKSLTTEIRKVENALELTAGEISEFSRFSIEGGNILGELERSVGRLLNLQESLLSMSGEDSQETEKAFMTFVNSIAESEATVDELRQSSSDLANLSRVLRELQESVASYRIAEDEVPVEQTTLEDAGPQIPEPVLADAPALHDLGVGDSSAPTAEEPAWRSPLRRVAEASETFSELREEMEADSQTDAARSTAGIDDSVDEHDPDKVEISQYYKPSGESDGGDDLIDLRRRN